MTYAFPNDIQQRIQAQMATGLFSNEDDVIREAIGSLEKRQRGLQQVQEMVQVAESDIDSDRIAAFNGERTKAAVRTRLADSRITE